MDRLFYVLLHAASALTGYPEPDHLPTMAPVSYERLQAMMCSKAPIPCKVPTAIYFKGVVYYDEKLNIADEYGQSIIVHELVHYVQDSGGWSQTDCMSKNQREWQAYDAQYKYLLSRGIDRPSIKHTLDDGRWWGDFCPDKEAN